MANAAINILGDGSICDICAVNGCVSDIVVTRTQVGTYQLEGTLGLVPPPDGWGVVTNPMDEITASVHFADGILTLQTESVNGKPADIISRVTLHILVKDQAPPEIPTLSSSVLQTMADAQYARLKGQADAQLQFLQDLLDIGAGSPEIEAQVLDLKRYRVALRNVSSQRGYPSTIEWPLMPE
ncbi:hypothetical protein M2401_001104 [Pseudomonas sp. JUb42]|uniref:tail fiber assembly protein n=1 Tax=Pseudomonas sp. JUb42 TaxID=2940611 RepID=UPI002169624F|nr:tail fiber assembly protein [Pseudomonas sp. JUb42]MCS3467383.1 hypothetical protein [Pseudomonas sp. JUb42]